MIKASLSTLYLSQVFRLRVALKDCSAVADKAGIASRFLPFKKKKNSLGMHFCRNLPTSVADLKFSIEVAYLIYISHLQWYWSSRISLGNNELRSPRRDGWKFNNIYILLNCHWSFRPHAFLAHLTFIFCMFSKLYFCRETF